MAWNWKQFIVEILGLAPTIISDVATDKAAFGSASHVQAATEATMQASQLAQSIDPGDTDKVAAATAITEGVIQGIFKPTPAAPTA